VTAPAFTAAPYAPYGAVHTFPVWGPTLASAWARACDGIAVDLGDATDLSVVGEPFPEMRWCPATRRVRLSGTMRVPDVDQGLPVDATLIPVFDVPAGFAPPVTRTGACASDGGWVRWVVSAASGQTPGRLSILTLGANFPPVTLGAPFRYPWVILDGITWRVPRT
jgi:hypothetical protein